MAVINEHDNYHHLAILTGHLGLHLIQREKLKVFCKAFMLLELNNEAEGGQTTFSPYIFFCKCFYSTHLARSSGETLRK